MIPVSTAEKNLVEKTFFVSTFLDSYRGFVSESRLILIRMLILCKKLHI